MDDVTNNDVQSAILAARADLDIDKRHTFMDASDSHDDKSIPVGVVMDPNTGIQRLEVLKDVLAVHDERASAPRRRRGNSILTELDSFIAHVVRYKSEDSTIIADVDSFALTAVYNENPSGPGADATGWRDHRATYACPRSPEWQTWSAADGKSLTQDQLADFIEERLEDLAAADGFPAPTDVLLMGRNLTVLTKGTFQRTLNPTTGAATLVCKSETDTGSTVIPRAFLIAVPVFEGGERYRVEVRIRMVLEARPMFQLVLHRRKEIERDAFESVRDKAAAGTAVPVFCGKA